jgi:hypothetical protein
LALIYALLDVSERICPEHLEAALAVWHYSAASGASCPPPPDSNVRERLYAAARAVG